LSPESVVFWIFVGAWTILALIFIFGVLPRLVGEGGRIVRRILTLIGGSPLTAQLARAELDVNRITSSLERVPALVQRAIAAVAIIRSTPLVPPAIASTIRRIQVEIAAFKRAYR
jgi:hypothetical protein